MVCCILHVSMLSQLGYVGFKSYLLDEQTIRTYAEDPKFNDRYIDLVSGCQLAQHSSPMYTRTSLIQAPWTGYCPDLRFARISTMYYTGL